MIAIIAAVMALQAADAWTWTLYDSDDALTLAHEVPDTPHLRTTLECDRGQGAARITLFRVSPAAAFATLTAGGATAQAELEPVRGGGLRVGAATDHPVMTAFAASGELRIQSGDRSEIVTVPRAHLAKLRRFIELCSG